MYLTPGVHKGHHPAMIFPKKTRPKPLARSARSLLPAGAR
jgi:hypothetical protein